MNAIALLPFAILFVCFAGLRMALTHSAFLALLVSTVITQTLFHATPEIWNAAIVRTLEITFEIGLILLGAFLFIETAHETDVIDSLARLVQKISPSRIVQGLLVSFPLTLMMEGSSGFGTPLLIITPILMALNFPLALCAILPFINFPVGIPFGALGTPIRLAFADPNLVSHSTFLLLAPFAIISPFLTYAYIHHFLPEKITWRSLFWTLLVGLIYFTVSFYVSKQGPEFPALAAGFFTFVFGLVSAPYFFPFSDRPSFVEVFLSERRGLTTYAFLLLTLWLGKQFFMDRPIPGTHVRLFNPGLIFIFFATALHLFFNPGSFVELIHSTLNRAKKTLFFFFCMTFLVQELRYSGALEHLTHALPLFFLQTGVPILGWLGSVFVGTSTVTNLLFAPIVDPSFHAALAAGTAVGVQLAFQAIIGVHSVLVHRADSELKSSVISEARLLGFLTPLSLGFVIFLVLWKTLINTL
jgi:lactate permease